MAQPKDPIKPMGYPTPIKTPKGATSEKERPMPVRFSDWASI